MIRESSVSRAKFVDLLTSSECPDERTRGSITLATLPKGFYENTHGVHLAFAKWERLRNKVSAQCLAFHIELFGEQYPVRLVSPGRLYRANSEWEMFFGVRSQEYFVTNRVGEQVLAMFPNIPKRFDIDDIVSKQWTQMSGGGLIRECDFKPLFEEATENLKKLLGSILFKGKDLADVVTPEEVREILTWCLVSGYLSLNQHNFGIVKLLFFNKRINVA